MERENKMGYMPIFKLVVNMSLPMIISMLVQALYNVVDSMFVSRVSENALTAVSLAFPAQNLMIGVATGTAVGVNALLSKSLGEKNYKRANQIAENGIFLSFIGFLIFLIFGLFGTEVFFRTQTDIEDIISSGVDYLRVCSCFSFGIFGQIIFERLMQSTGRTFYTMITQGVGAIINIVLDPIFIFGYFGLPAMGAKGAAIATVIGQIIAFIIAAILNKKKNTDIDLKLKEFRPNLKIIGRIYSIGIPSIIMVAVGSIMTFSINKIVIAFTETAAAVFGVYFKLQSFVFMPLFGMNNGVIPIISFNYGARNKQRVMKTIGVAILFALFFMAIGLAAMQILPKELLSIFNASDQMIKIGVPALKTISISYIFAGFSVVLISVFQAFGKGLFSMSISIARQLVVLVPCAYLLSKTGELDNVWWAFPIAEVMSVLVAGAFFIYLYKKVITKLDTEQKQ
ncbi:MAG: MATE family efflux transporter [Oscillospiraceae bacterium]|nr:MATE family efflux transporter [Oscillospiraceae bacterium]